MSGNERLRAYVAGVLSDGDFAAKKRRFKAIMVESMRLINEAEKARERGDYLFERPPLPGMPPELCGLPCGARTRAGTPCKRLDTWGNGRCKHHGGMSTGPRTKAGKKRARANLKLGRVKREPHGKRTNDNIPGRRAEAVPPTGTP